MSEQQRGTFRETRAMRDVCARDIADHVIADDTTSESFAAALRLYQKLGDELDEATRELDSHR